MWKLDCMHEFIEHLLLVPHILLVFVDGLRPLVFSAKTKNLLWIRCEREKKSCVIKDTKVFTHRINNKCRRGIFYAMNRKKGAHYTYKTIHMYYVWMSRTCGRGEGVVHQWQYYDVSKRKRKYKYKKLNACINGKKWFGCG